MKIIVPGGSGFIGKNFVLNAPRDWEIIALYNKSKDFVDFVSSYDLNNVTPVQCDLTKDDNIKSFFDKYGNDFDVCVYLVANLSIPLSVENPSFDLTLNTSTLLNFLTHFRGEKIIFFSSGAVYDGLEGFVSPMSEVNPKIPYAISKLASEQYINFFQHRKKTFHNYIILRFFGAYGPYEASRKIYTKLIKTFYFENKNVFTLYGNGRNYIDAMYIDDAIDGLIKVIKSDKKNLTLDFCCGTPYTIDKLVREAAKIFGKQDVILKHKGRTEEHIKFHSSNESMKRLFNFIPTTSLREGLLKFADWLNSCGRL